MKHHTKEPTQPADQAIRDQALGPGESFHLEAPAGSGKTSVLLARFLTLLARVDTPEEMLALTFTRKAAGELRARVMALLWERREPGPDASPLDLRLRELAAAVFRRHGDEAQLKLTPERLPIMTFHGFGAQLLKLAPQEAGAPLTFNLLEEDEARWLKVEALDEMRRRLNGRPARDPVRQALVRRLVRLNNDWRRLAQELSGLVSRRDSLGDFLALARVSRDAAAYRQLLEDRFKMVLQPSLEELRAGLGDHALGKAWPGFWRALQGSGHGDLVPPELPGSSPADLSAWQAVSEVLLTKQGAPRKRLSAKDGFPEGFDQKALVSPDPGPARAGGQVLEAMPGPDPHRGISGRSRGAPGPGHPGGRSPHGLRTALRPEGGPGFRGPGGGYPESPHGGRPHGGHAPPGLAPQAYPGGRIPGHQHQPDAAALPPDGRLAVRLRTHPDGGGGPQAIHLWLAPGQAAPVHRLPGRIALRRRRTPAPDAP